MPGCVVLSVQLPVPPPFQPPVQPAVGPPLSTAKPQVAPDPGQSEIEGQETEMCEACIRYKPLLACVGYEVQAYQSIFHSLVTWLDGEMHAGLRKMQGWEYLRRETICLGRAPMQTEVLDLASSLVDKMVMLQQEFEGDPVGAAEVMFGQGGQMWSESDYDDASHANVEPGNGGQPFSPVAAVASSTAFPMGTHQGPSRHADLHQEASLLSHLEPSSDHSPVSSGGFSNLPQDDAMDLDSSSAGEDSEEE